ncbi:hypothetical protein BGW39_010892 [Mortierella sp. 14UC]|nr:hypothetical protein BGW39_010892 [Mortierella sp. 14UC]
MANTTSPTIRARNAKRKPSGLSASSKAAGGPRLPVTPYADRKLGKKSTVNPYLAGFLLVMLSGGALMQMLKLFGFRTEDMDDYY